MKIGIFSECYHPVLNGVVVSIDTFKNELEKRGHEYTIFTVENPGLKETDPKVIRYSSMIPFKAKGGRYPISWPQFFIGSQAKRISKYNFDIIHSQHMLGLGILGLKIGKRLNIPTILTYHTLLAEYAHYSPIFPGMVRNYLIKKSRSICNQYDQIVTPSNPMKDVLIEYGVTKPITSIPTGVDIEGFKNHYSSQDLRQKYNIPDSQKTILLYVSRIAKEKNVDLLLNAAEKIGQKRQDFHLLMVGGGPELENYKSRMAKGNIKDQITFTGMIEKQEVNKYFGAADVFVFPSITETQGIVITEAMASGVPAVAINKMGPSDIIEDGEDGFLTDLNLEAFADKIEFLIQNENLRKKMGENALKAAVKFSVKTTCDQMEKLYEETRRHRP